MEGWDGVGKGSDVRGRDTCEGPGPFESLVPRHIGQSERPVPGDSFVGPPWDSRNSRNRRSPDGPFPRLRFRPSTRDLLFSGTEDRSERMVPVSCLGVFRRPSRSRSGYRTSRSPGPGDVCLSGLSIKETSPTSDGGPEVMGSQRDSGSPSNVRKRTLRPFPFVCSPSFSLAPTFCFFFNRVRSVFPSSLSWSYSLARRRASLGSP